jgi:hypothetical protein
MDGKIVCFFRFPLCLDVWRRWQVLYLAAACIGSACKKPISGTHKHAEGVENNPWQKKKCTRQLALNAVRNAKYRSNLIQPGQFTAASAGPRNDPQEARDDTKPLKLNY